MNRIISQIINIISIVIMGYFAIPKLLANPMSVAGFNQFESAIHIDSDFFRVLTGISEISIALLILVFAIMQKLKLGLFVYGFLLVTMVTALALEFIARPEPKILLVIIAIALTLFSIYQIFQLTSKQYES